MALNRSKGQVFVMSAIIFSSIVLIAITSTQQTYTTDTTAEISTYFDSSLERQGEIVDSGLKKNKSAESVKKELYTFNRFVERQSEGRSISYEAMQFVVLPSKEEAVVVNYRPRMVSYDFRDSSWENDSSLNPYQSDVITIEQSQDYRFISDDLGIDREFNASEPAFIGYMRMESGDSVLTDQIFR